MKKYIYIAINIFTVYLILLGVYLLFDHYADKCFAGVGAISNIQYNPKTLLNDYSWHYTTDNGYQFTTQDYYSVGDIVNVTYYCTLGTIINTSVE